MEEAVRTRACISKGLKNPARRQDQWKRPRLSQEPESSPTHAHNHFAFSIPTPLSPLPFMLSCPLPLIPSPPANKAKWVLWCGGRKGAKGKTPDGERRTGAQQMGTEIRNSKHALERHHWRKDDIFLKSHTCSKLHACSAALYKRPHATTVTPAAAVVMVTIIMLRVDQTTEGSNALLAWYSNHRFLPWIYKCFNENAWRQIPNCCIHKHHFLEIPFSLLLSAPGLIPLRRSET